MAFAGIFQPFARLRWIRFGLLMRGQSGLESPRCNPNPEPPAEFAVKDEVLETA
jgi:hypothetical protein